MRSHLKIILFGGLGNQLFQYAIGLQLIRYREVSFESSLGKPRVDQKGNLDLLGFVLPNDAPIISSSASARTSKILNAFLKISSVSYSQEILSKGINGARAVLRLLFRKYVVFPDGVGFSQIKLMHSKARYVVGNFHSYKWFDDEWTLEALRSIRLQNKPRWVAEMAIQSEVEMPIVVHVRRGDYTTINELGILQENYFRLALEKATQNYPDSRIWVFSDNFREAGELLPSIYAEKYLYVSEEPWNSAAHLETMRLGQCFIISNSTFSWWAAFLRYNISAPVYCPENWFLTKPNPESMIPDDWIKVSLK